MKLPLQITFRHMDPSPTIEANIRARAARLDRFHDRITGCHVAIRDTFNAAQRRLQDHARRRRGEVKSHEAPPHGRVARLFPAQDYGFIATADGRELYFHRNAVVGGGFDGLEVGAEVRFAEARGDEGPQASTVNPAGKHHIVD